jgi:hypothetical protein
MGIRACGGAIAAVVRIVCEVYLAAIRGQPIAITVTRVTADVAGARGAAGGAVRGAAGRGTAAAVILVVGDVRFTPVGQVTVAVAVTRGAVNATSSVVAGRRSVAGRADLRTGSAVAGVRLQVYFTTIGCVAVAVVVAGIASDSANAIGTRSVPVNC